MRHKNIVKLFVVGAVIGAVASCYQLFDMIEYETGFFYPSATKAGWLVSVFIAAVVICVGLIAAQERRLPPPPDKNEPIFAAVSVVYAAVFAYEGVTNSFLSSVSSGVGILIKLLGVLSAISIILFGIKDIINFSRASLLTAVPLLYTVLRLILTFFDYSHMPTIAFNVYELAYLCFSLLFWLYMSMLGFGVNVRNSMTRLLPITLMGAVVAAVASVPQLVAIFTRPEAVHNGTVSPIVMPFFVLYSVIYVLFCIYYKKRIPRHHSRTPKMNGKSDSNQYYYGGEDSHGHGAKTYIYSPETVYEQMEKISEENMKTENNTEE